MNSRPRLLFWTQHSLGLGHLVRSLALAEGLSERFCVTLLSGGALPDGLNRPASLDVIELPALHATATWALASDEAGGELEQVRAARRQAVLATYDALEPDVVLLELFPFGRKKFAGELLPLLERASATKRRRPLVAASVRDILVRLRPDQDAHDEQASIRANRFLDVVLVHSDPRLARFEESFRPTTPLRVPLIYTGFVQPRREARGKPLIAPGSIVVSAGGGRVGGSLLRAALEAYRLLPGDARPPLALIAGPFLAEAELAELKRAARLLDGVRILRSVPDLSTELEGAAASVSQCGYNTALELLSTGVPALVVPYATEEEDEQGRRARKLAEYGAVRLLEPDRLTPAALADELARLAAFRPTAVDFTLDGAYRSADLLASHWAAWAGQTEAVPA